MLKLFKCGACGKEKKHYFGSVDQVRVLKCSCGSENYNEKLGMFSSKVNYKTQEEIMENEIDPSIDNMFLKMGKEMVNGDVATMENVYGEAAMKETFYEEDQWVNEVDLLELNK